MLDRRDIFRVGATGLLASSVTPSRSQSQARATYVAASLAELRAAPISVAAILYDGAIYNWVAGDHSEAPRGPADGVYVVKQIETPLTAGAWVRQSDVVSVRKFGAIEGSQADSATNTAAFNRAIARAVALGRPLDLVGGFYRLDADGEASGGINFAHEGLVIRGGGATLQFCGSGRAFVLDRGGGDGNFLEGMSIQGIIIIGGPRVTDGFYARGIVRSNFRNIQVRDVSGKAFHIRHAVSNLYDNLKYSPPAKSKVYATHGLYIDNNGAGYYSTNSIFLNTIIENFPGIGCLLENATGLFFGGGTFEACATGLVISKNSHDNVFVKVWMEANGTADAIVSGSNNGFIGARFLSFSFSGPNVHITDNGRGTWFAGGGFIRHVEMAAGSSGTTFHQVGVDENRSGTIGFQGAGSYTRIGCSKIGAANDVVGVYDDIIGPVQSIGDNGTWAPVLKSASGEIRQNPVLTQGSFHKVGKLVFAQCFIGVGSVHSPAGALSIAGLPYVSAFRQPGSVYATRLRPTATEPLQVQIEPKGAVLSLSKLSSGSAVDMAADIAGGTTLAVSIIYSTAD